MKFEQMNLIRPILRAIREVGYTEPTPIQQKTVPPVLLGKDVLGCAQTGTGKTAAFALPILQRIVRADEFSEQGMRPIRALILTPTRELALQIYENFTQYGKHLSVRCAVIFGGVNQNPQVEQLRAGVDILVATPGRLNDLIGQGYISLQNIRIFVLDEADRMLDMGFIHDVRKVMNKLPAERQTLLFSATMPPQVEEIAEQLLTDPVNIKISPVTSTVDSVEQSVYFLAKPDKIKLLLHLLGGHGVSSALVFTRTKHGADQVARQLNKNDVKALAIHGNKSQNARQTALSRFKAGDIDVLVATDIAARGIDIVELPTVINYNVPEEPETYIHRIGRTGRAGMEGVAITFCCSDELESFRDIEKLIGRRVTELSCDWSVADMQPTKPEPRQQNPRGERAVAKVSAQEKNESTQKSKSKKTVKQPKEQGVTPHVSQPQTEKQPKRSNPEVKAEQPQTKVEKTPKPPKRDATNKQEKARNIKKEGTSEMKKTVAEPMPTSKREEPPHRGKNSRSERKPLPRHEKPTVPNADRRYADSGEHDGATGQQIVTNFNRSVWLEFNEPPKRPKKMWQEPLMQAKKKETEVAPQSIDSKKSGGSKPEGQKTAGHRFRRRGNKRS